MELDITIKNYRCFADNNPARITVRPGITSVVGKNNAGKSTLLKFIYEFRHMFNMIADASHLVEALRHNPRGFSMMPHVKDHAALFCDLNERDIVISLTYREANWDQTLIPARIDLTLKRGTNSYVADVYAKNGSKID